MALKKITINVPENIYIRLQQAAHATKQSLDEVLLRVVRTGSPPAWDDIPAEFQSDVAALERLDDQTLWRILQHSQTETDQSRYQDLLDKNRNASISDAEYRELDQLRTASDRLMICKAHAAALLKWRGHHIPPVEKIQVAQ